MFNRLRKTLVESFVGTIALGWLLAQACLDFAFIFSAPLTGWISRREYLRFADHAPVAANFTLQDALPELVKFVCVLLVWFVLFRWLYLKPAKAEPAESTSNSA